MKRRELERLVDAVTETVMEACAEGGVPPDTCVLQAKLVMEVLREAGAVARPFPVKVRVFSPEAARRVEAGEVPPTELGTAREAEWLAADATIAMIGYGSPHPLDPERWDGHLCCLAGNRYLIDPTLGQLRHSLERPVEADGFWSEVPREFVRGAEPVSFRMASGVVAVYDADPGNRAFFRGSHWRREAPIARRLLRMARRR